MITVAALGSGAGAFLEARERQDELLLAVGRLVQSGRLGDGGGLAAGVDDESIAILPIAPGDETLGGLPSGLHTREVAGRSWRLSIETPSPSSDVRFVVAQQTAVRDESAQASAILTFVPAALLVALTLLVVNVVVRRQFARLDALAARLECHEENGARALDGAEVPDEVRPFLVAITRLRERDASLLRRQRRFVADAAHELRSPIAALSLQTENLERGGHDEGEQERRVGRVGQSVARLQRLVAQLLDLAYLQDEGVFVRERIDAHETVCRVVAEAMPLADAVNVDLGVVESMVLALQDEGEAFARLLRNALDNAIRHSPPGGRVDIRLLRDAEHAVLLVEDEGPGLPEADLERVFKPFHRGDEASGGGTGLGLSICREIARRLGGEVRLENRFGGGLRFLYRQPLSADPDTTEHPRVDGTACRAGANTACRLCACSVLDRADQSRRRSPALCRTD